MGTLIRFNYDKGDGTSVSPREGFYLKETGELIHTLELGDTEYTKSTIAGIESKLEIAHKKYLAEIKEIALEEGLQYKTFKRTKVVGEIRKVNI